MVVLVRAAEEQRRGGGRAVGESVMRACSRLERRAASRSGGRGRRAGRLVLVAVVGEVAGRPRAGNLWRRVERREGGGVEVKARSSGVGRRMGEVEVEVEEEGEEGEAEEEAEEEEEEGEEEKEEVIEVNECLCACGIALVTVRSVGSVSSRRTICDNGVC